MASNLKVLPTSGIWGMRSWYSLGLLCENHSLVPGNPQTMGTSRLKIWFCLSLNLSTLLSDCVASIGYDVRDGCEDMIKCLACHLRLRKLTREDPEASERPSSQKAAQTMAFIFLLLYTSEHK
jgi:ferredoxin